jgi:TPR repeat protein
MPYDGGVRWLLFALALASTTCSKPDREAAVAKELAMIYERGDGAPRDYTMANQIHQKLCADGRGDLVACRRLVENHTRHRGELDDPRVDVWKLLTLACQGGDWLSCGAYIPFDEAAALAACESDQPAACLAINSMHFMSQSGTLEQEDAERRRRACRGGVLEACLEIVTYAGYADEAPPEEAAAAVTAACDQGDADACAALGKPIDPAELCRANDYEACAIAGASDPGPLAKACDHDVLEACESLAFAARDADPPDPRVVEYFDRACKLKSDEACRQNKPQDLEIGCGAYLPARVPGASRRSLPRLTGTVGGSAWSAPEDQPFLVFTYDTRNNGADVYPRLAQALGDDVAVYVLVYADADTDATELAPAIAVVLDPALADERLTTETGVMSRLSRPLRAGAAVVDATGVPRALFSTEWGIVPATMARCTRAILAEP